MKALNERIALELKKAKGIWKDLLHYRQADVQKISDLFHRYKCFLEENRQLLWERSGYRQKETFAVESLLNQYHELSGLRDKKFLLNDVYVGLMFNVSESIGELEERLEEDAFTGSDQVVFS